MFVFIWKFCRMIRNFGGVGVKNYKYILSKRELGIFFCLSMYLGKRRNDLFVCFEGRGGEIVLMEGTYDVCFIGRIGICLFDRLFICFNWDRGRRD